MPIFEFRCLACGHVFERLFVRSHDAADLRCPECRSTSAERVVSRASYTMGAGPGDNRPRMTEKSCGSGNRCMTLDLPGPAK